VEPQQRIEGPAAVRYVDNSSIAAASHVPVGETKNTYVVAWAEAFEDRVSLLVEKQVKILPCMECAPRAGQD
jgi:hypothetical protein